MRDISIEWLTGFWEGEGSLCFTRDKCPVLLVQMYQKDRRVLDQIVVAFGGVVKKKVQGGVLGVRECHHVLWTGRKAFSILARMLPHVRCPRRKQQIMDAIARRREYEDVRVATKSSWSISELGL